MDADKSMRAEVLSRARAILADGKRRTGQQIAHALSKNGLPVSKSLVNSILFREGRPYVQYDRTTFTYGRKLGNNDPDQVDNSAPTDRQEQDGPTPAGHQPDNGNAIEGVFAPLLQGQDMKTMVLKILAEHGPATMNQLTVELQQLGYRFTGLELWRLIQQLRDDGHISEPIAHESSTVAKPVFVYQIQDPSVIELPAPAKEAVEETCAEQAAPVDLREAVIDILRQNGPLTFDDLLAELHSMGAESSERPVLIEILKALYHEGTLATPEGRRATLDARPVYYFSLQTERPPEPAPQPTDPATVTLDAAIVAVLEEVTTVTISEILSMLKKKFEISADRLTIHEALKQLRKQGIVAEPEKHPTHNVYAPLYVYRLKRKAVAPPPTPRVQAPAKSEIQSTPREKPATPAQPSISTVKQPATGSAPKTRRALLQELLAEIGRPTHYSVLHKKANARLPQDDDFSKAAVYSTMAYSDVFKSHGGGVFGLALWSHATISESRLATFRYCPMPLLPKKAHPNAFFDSVVLGRDLLSEQSLDTRQFWRQMKVWARRTDNTSATDAQEAFDAWYAVGLIQHIQFRRHSNKPLTLTLPTDVSLQETRAHCLDSLCQRVQHMPELLWSLAHLAHPAMPSIKTLLFGDEKDGFDVPRRLTMLASLGAVHEVGAEWRLTRTGHAALDATPPQELPDLTPLESLGAAEPASRLRWDDERLGLLDLDGLEI